MDIAYGYGGSFVVITLVDYFVRFFRPYKDLPEFERCIEKAVEELKPKPARCELDTACDT